MGHFVRYNFGCSGRAMIKLCFVVILFLSYLSIQTRANHALLTLLHLKLLTLAEREAGFAIGHSYFLLIWFKLCRCLNFTVIARGAKELDRAVIASSSFGNLGK